MHFGITLAKIILEGILLTDANDHKKKLYPSLLLKVVIWVLVVIVIMSFVKISLSYIQSRYQIEELNAQVLSLENEKKALVQEKESVATDEYIEKIARERLGMVQPKETPIRVEEKTYDNKSSQNLSFTEKSNIYLTEWYDYMNENLNKLKK